MSLTSQESTKSYEREAEATRQRLSTSLDELATNLTPGTMLDEVLSYARAGGGDFLRGLGSAASANPIPTLLIGLGAAMFLTGRGRIDGKTDRAANGHGVSILRHAADLMRRRAPAGTPRPDWGSTRRMPAGPAGMATDAGGDPYAAAPASYRDVGTAHYGASGVRGAARSAADAVSSVAGSAVNQARSAAASTADAVGSAAAMASGAVGSAASTASDAVRSTASFAADQVRSGASAMGSAASGAAGAIRDTATAGIAAAGDLAASAGDMASGAAGAVVDTAGAVVDRAGALASAARDSAAEQGQRLVDQTTRLTHELTERTNRVIQEQPLAVAAAGLAIGAALAAALPRTRFEDSLLGETSDALKDTVAGAATEQFQRAKQATGRAVEEARKVAEKEGLSTSAAADAIREVSEKVKHVVTAAGTEVKKEAEKTAAPLASTPDKPAEATTMKNPGTWPDRI
jgi:hypothetical protein